MSDIVIGEFLEFSGDWHLPFADGSACSKVQGNFKWADRKGQLQLFGTFIPTKSGPLTAAGPTQHPVIHGETTSSKHVTMLDTLSVGTNITNAEAGFKARDSYESRQCIIGAHVTADTVYRKLTYRIPGLFIWLGAKGASISFTNELPHYFTYSFDANNRELLNFSEANLAVELGIKRELPMALGATLKIQSYGYLSIIPNFPQTLEWMINEAAKVVAMLSTIAGAPMFPDAISAFLPDGSEVGMLIALNSRSNCEFTHPHEFFVSRDAIGLDLQKITTKWLAAYDKLMLPTQLALSVFSSNNLWLHVEFISLMQALEGLHRASLPGKYLSDGDYLEIVKVLNAAIPSSFDDNFRESLKSRIRYGNEYSLRKRLKEMVDPLPTSIKLLILQGQIVPGQWVDTRNYYTHWDESARASALDGAAMHHACVRMKLLLRVLILFEIGVSEELLVSALQGTNTESQYLLQLNRSK